MAEPTFADGTLARRLEKSEALANLHFVEARARLQPDSGACWIEAGGAWAMFDGADSPVTQTFGLGMFEPVSASGLEELEAFFRERGAPVHHEVSPHAGVEVFAELVRRGYQPVELTSVMFLPLGDLGEVPPSPLPVRVAGTGECDVWADVSARGWAGEMPEIEEFLRGFGGVMARREQTTAFLADLDGEPVAAGALCIEEGCALFGGACTVPEARRHGAQMSLLNERLRYSVAAGCDLAMMCAAPGSSSQRNAERNGFRIAYTRTKWRLG